MFEAKQGELFENGTYRKGRIGAFQCCSCAGSVGVLVVNFCCPKCASYMALVGPKATHSIADDGTVSPSVVCDCGFHEFVKLVDWKKGK